MRVLALAVALIALPAAAADVTETISPRYVSATLVERAVLGSDAENATPHFGPRGAFPSVVPSGITAFSVDADRNTITLTGSPEAIGKFREILRLLDIPSRSVRLDVRVLRLVPEELRRLKNAGRLEIPDPSHSQLASIDELPEEVLAGLRETRPISPIRQTVQNNGKLRLFAPETESRLQRARITPRVNGDQTVTLFIQLPLLPDEVGPERDGQGRGFLRRLPAGASTLFVDEAHGIGLLVTYERLVVAPEQPERTKP